MADEVTTEQVIEAARKRWPEADTISVSLPTHTFDERAYTISHCKLAVCGPPDYEGDSPASIYTAPSLPALLKKIEES